MWLLSLSSLSCGNTVRGSDRLFTVFNRCAESSKIQPSMISIMANFGNICICFFFLVTTTLALHHDWDVEISRCKKQEQERNIYFLLREENRQWIPVARGEPEVVVSKWDFSRHLCHFMFKWDFSRQPHFRRFYVILCPSEKSLIFFRNKKNFTSDIFRTTSPHEDTVRMESNNNVAALLHRVNF